MNEKMHKAVFGSPDKLLQIGGVSVPCYVLENGERVISGRGLQDALIGAREKSGDKLSKVLRSRNLVDFLSEKLGPDILENRIEFTGRNNRTIYGYKSDVLIDLANFFIEADSKELLTNSQKKYAVSARIIASALSKTALIELIDSVTGYRDVRREAIEKILDMYIRKEFAAWAKRFPDEFYRLIFKLNKWPYDPKSKKRPGIIGKYTNEIVYSRLAPGILENLQTVNPSHHGQRKRKHHQWLTDDIGHPKLQEHMSAVLALMRASTDWRKFIRMLNRALPIKNEKLLFDIHQYDDYGQRDL